VMEPRVQGAAGMWMHPPGFLKHVAQRCKEHGIWLMLDEVMTGFGRTGAMFACDKENVKPDFVALAKGLTGGYLPLGATLMSGEIFRAFTGERASSKTFFHGHSYCGNALGCAVALASLDLFRDEAVITKVTTASKWLARAAEKFWEHPNVGDVRQEGMICAIELVEDARTRDPFDSAKRTGVRVCRAAMKYGLLTRPIGDVLVLMPPYCVTRTEVNLMTQALWSGLCEVLPTKSVSQKQKKRP
jgi:adenosylmethionine---8-amino-7-oxononanoate aminotransferase